MCSVRDCPVSCVTGRAVIGCPDQLVCYLGVNPKVKRSGNAPATHGRITKPDRPKHEGRWSRPPSLRLGLRDRGERSGVAVNSASAELPWGVRVAVASTPAPSIRDRWRCWLDSFQRP
jgi:hypothetical protein